MAVALSFAELINARGQLKAKLTRFVSFIQKLETDPTQINEVLDRRNEIDAVYTKFDAIQNSIELSEHSDETQLHERESFEDKYYAVRAKSSAFITAKAPINVPQGTSGHTVADRDENYAQVNIKLPQINLQEYDGAFDKWIQFRDSFKNAVHDNQNLGNTQKLNYLISTLKGNAASVIENIEITDDNYHVAWDLLVETFENKKIIVHSHIKNLFNLPNITRDSHVSIRSFYNNFKSNFRALKSLKQPVDQWGSILIYLLFTKLDVESRKSWEDTSKEDADPSIDSFSKFLAERCKFLESLHNKGTIANNSNIPTNISNRDNKRFSQNKLLIPRKTFAHITIKQNCVYCKGAHPIYGCEAFLNMSPNSRMNEITKLRNTCVNCLRPGHYSNDCRQSSCRLCNKRHNTLLHTGQIINDQAIIGLQSSDSRRNQPFAEGNREMPNTSSNAHSLANFAKMTLNAHSNQTQVLLATAIVNIRHTNGQFLKCRALLDSGSQSNFITNNLARKLNLKLSNINIAVSGIAQAQTYISGKSRATIKSCYNDYTSTLDLLAIDNITGFIPHASFDRASLNIPPNIKLADPNFNESAPIDLLIGAGTYCELFSVGQIKLSKTGPILQKTVLGYIISGNYHNQSHASSSTSRSLCHVSNLSNISDQLERFWLIEENRDHRVNSQDEQFCEEHFVKTTSRDINGRFIVSLPLREDHRKLGNSQERAISRFNALENKLAKNPTIKQQYINFMQEYEELGHMTEINPNLPAEHPIYYLPHHNIKKESSSTSKFRTVFDGSAKTTSGVSLNDVLLVGPTIQDGIFSIILRFRTHNYVLKADVAKMYRQVLVNQDQRNLQRIVWRDDSTKPLRHFQLNTVTYGTASASFLATRCLKQMGLDNINRYPAASQAILNSFYVDDVITGTADIETALKLKRDLETVLSEYGFELRKWVSNDRRILQGNALNSTTKYIITENENDKTLGVIWDSSDDCLHYSSNCIKDGNNKITKRSTLSITAQFWDETIPIDLHTAWIKFYNQLSAINLIKFPRHALLRQPHEVQLHGFSDASETAYGACVYLRSQDSSGNTLVSLICAKSKVAPLKTISLPRLELCGSLLLAKLMQRVKSDIGLNISDTFYWCDSTIVLSWLSTTSKTWKTFVCNRVAKIQDVSDVNKWHHISSGDNPADIISRGMYPTELLNSNLWFHGPQWLSLEKCYWPQGNSTILSQDVPEARPITQITLVSTDILDIFNRYSSFTKLVRVASYIRRFHKNTTINKENKTLDDLTLAELSEGTNLIIKLAQQQEFSSEINSLKKSNSVSKHSKLASLAPFIDNNDLIRVGGRLNLSQLNYNQRHQILLPYGHQLTKLIISHEHKRNLHAGAQAILCTIRQNYWPINGRQSVRNVLRKCIICFKSNPYTIKYQMGQLPATRVNVSRAFTNVGIDYAGPFQIRDGKLRNRKDVKCYICIFVCLATKAVHLEAVGDLTADSFLNSFKRFTSRRGLCKTVMSDNATNFVGANSQLINLVKCVKDSNFINYLSSNNIDWKFIPARSPHFGGIWESAVKSAKTHLKRVSHNLKFTYEEFYTLLTQIEAVLNSRPIFPLSNDPNDLQPLTPGHFLIGEPLNAVPQADLQHIALNQLSRYQHLQRLVQHFWTRWSREYLNTLQQRTKWKVSDNNEGSKLIGSLVLLKEDNHQPLEWRLGRIVEVHPGIDNIIRVVSVKTRNSVVKRAVVKVCPLPVGEL